MIRREAFVPLVTYPDPASDRIASNAVAVARHLGFDLHALALDVDIPNLSSALGNLLLNLPEMIREAEETSRARGLSLLGAITAQAARAEVALTTGTLAAVRRGGRGVRIGPAGPPASGRRRCRSDQPRRDRLG